MLNFGLVVNAIVRSRCFTPDWWDGPRFLQEDFGKNHFRDLLSTKASCALHPASGCRLIIERVLLVWAVSLLAIAASMMLDFEKAAEDQS
jgi:hypothetical protein